MISVVTGANGFIGQRLTRALLDIGHHVYCLDICPPGNNSLSHKRVEYHTVDCADMHCLENSKVLDRADYVFHLAGVTKGVDHNAFFEGNVLPTKILLDLLEKKKISLRRFVFISTQAAAGPAKGLDHPVKESDRPHPVEDYSATKLEAEAVVRQHGHKIPFTIIRPSSVYGPGDIDFLNIFNQIKHHLSIYPGYKNKYLSIIHVDDLVRGMLLAVSSKTAKGKTYFLSNKNPVTWKTVHRTMAQVASKKVIEINMPWWTVALVCRLGDLWTQLSGRPTIANSRKAALSKQPYWICSAELAFKDFGFLPEISLTDGLSQTFQWYVQNRWL